MLRLLSSQRLGHMQPAQEYVVPAPQVSISRQSLLHPTHMNTCAANPHTTITPMHTLLWLNHGCHHQVACSHQPPLLSLTHANTQFFRVTSCNMPCALNQCRLVGVDLAGSLSYGHIPPFPYYHTRHNSCHIRPLWTIKPRTPAATCSSAAGIPPPSPLVLQEP
eukprot:GHRR01012997.1.p2 GENE.GHRR01012997.1~~GHRR01012997.1.p2  ORF type:complete len:164 (-),score=23.74 GHRR01012997.1:1399-1890(-)